MNIRKKAKMFLAKNEGIRREIDRLNNEGYPSYIIADKLNLPEYYIIVALGRD